MTSKEALDRLKFIWDKETNTGYKSPKELDDFWGISKPLKTIEKLVERDTPIKVEYDDMDNRCCPICAEVQLPNVYATNNEFCPYCGQRLDWSGENE